MHGQQNIKKRELLRLRRRKVFTYLPINMGLKEKKVKSSVCMQWRHVLD